MRTFIGCLVVCALTLEATGVRAEPSPAESGVTVESQRVWRLDDERPPRDEPSGGRSWYGWQTLAADGASGVVLLVATQLGVLAPPNENFTHPGYLGYVFGAPIIHAAHGHWGLAFGSLGLRTAPYFLSNVALACGFQQPFSDTEPDLGCTALSALMLASIALPIGLDGSVFGWDEAEKTPPSRVQLAPWVASESAGVIVGGRY